MLDPLETLRIAIGNISNSKLRSALTTLGIMIGAVVVIANVSMHTSFFEMSDDKKRYHIPTMIETSRSRVKRFVYTLINN